MLETQVLIIGAGPAGSATAICLAEAGLRVVLVEQQEFPRQKVCGECISAGGLAILDDLGVGEEVRASAGPEIRQVAWMGSKGTVLAPFPRCSVGAYGYGRAIGRDRLDRLLLGRARSLGVRVVQPARVRRVAGTPGHFLCDIEARNASTSSFGARAFTSAVCSAQVVIDAHGSWEQPVKLAGSENARNTVQRLARDSDLFAFKATYTQSRLAAGLLPVISFPGGYGGIVIAGDGQATLACCIRRDTLRASRAFVPGQSAGAAVAATLLRSCRGLGHALSSAQQEIAWLSVGPIRPGIRVDQCNTIFRVGNAAGEAHPLIGEGINMALHSARLAAAYVRRLVTSVVAASELRAANRRYAIDWRAAFGSRLRYARWYAHLAMRPSLANPLSRILQAQPSLMTHAARWAGKARGATDVRSK